MLPTHRIAPALLALASASFSASLAFALYQVAQDFSSAKESLRFLLGLLPSYTMYAAPAACLFLLQRRPLKQAMAIGASSGLTMFAVFYGLAKTTGSIESTQVDAYLFGSAFSFTLFALLFSEGRTKAEGAAPS
ncbi:MAG: hypothetical protein AAF517_24480 [Planctomycetota bacterium]